jgi:hypothetical protein
MSARPAPFSLVCCRVMCRQGGEAQTQTSLLKQSQQASQSSSLLSKYVRWCKNPLLAGLGLCISIILVAMAVGHIRARLKHGQYDKIGDENNSAGGGGSSGRFLGAGALRICELSRRNSGSGL